MLNLVREGEEDYIEAIRYRRRLKIFENFLRAPACRYLSQQSQRLTRIIFQYFYSTSVVTFGFDEVHDHVELVCFGFSWFVNYLR